MVHVKLHRILYYSYVILVHLGKPSLGENEVGFLTHLFY